MSDEIRTIYQIVIGDIEYSKKQQWAITNYGLLSYAATYAVADKILASAVIKNMSSKPFKVVYIFYAICVVICITFIKILNQFENSLKSYRKNKNEILNDNNAFSKEFRRVISTDSDKSLNIYRIMIAVILFGCATTLILLYFAT